MITKIQLKSKHNSRKLWNVKILFKFVNELPSVVNKSADVCCHRSLARSRRTGVVGVEAEPFQESTQSDIIPAVEVHLDDPRRYAKMWSIGGCGAVTGEEDVQVLQLERIQTVDCALLI